MKSDRILGAVVVLGALAFVASASAIPHNRFLSGPLAPGMFPMIIGIAAAVCGAVMLVRPDDEADWPPVATLLALALSVVVMVAYAYALKPLGFLAPTAIAATVISWQITPRPKMAVVTGVAIAVGLFVIFRYGLGLGLMALPRSFGG